MTLLGAAETASLLPYNRLADEIAQVLLDAAVKVPDRLVQALPGGGSLFVMPALDGRIAITKLITFTPGNAGTSLATIQGDVVVFDIATGQRRLVLDGPTVTARRTAAVSLLAARSLAPNTHGPLLIVGAGAQGKSHLEAFAAGLSVTEVVIVSRSRQSAYRLAEHAKALGLRASVADDANAALMDCPLIVTCTPAHGVVLSALPRADAFVAAVGAFTPQMLELGADLCRHFDQQGRIVVDTTHAASEAGDLLRAGLDVAAYTSLGQILAERLPSGNPSPSPSPPRPVLFKSCGWAGWDLAAARLAFDAHD